MKEKLLILEDDPVLSNMLKTCLKPYFRVYQASNIHGALYCLEDHSPLSMVLIDRTLPDGDGLDFLEPLKMLSPDAKTCIMSGLSSSFHKVEGLHAGADYYLPKPFGPEEVKAVLLSLMRRGAPEQPHQKNFQDLLLDTAALTLTRGRQCLRLTKREFEYLLVFFSNRGGTAPSEKLIEIGKSQAEFQIGKVHTMIQRLRKHLKPLGISILSRYGLGYQLELQKQKDWPV